MKMAFDLVEEKATTVAMKLGETTKPVWTDREQQTIDTYFDDDMTVVVDVTSYYDRDGQLDAMGAETRVEYLDDIVYRKRGGRVDMFVAGDAWESHLDELYERARGEECNGSS